MIGDNNVYASYLHKQLTLSLAVTNLYQTVTQTDSKPTYNSVLEEARSSSSHQLSNKHESSTQIKLLS